jgi:hypothetical protein
VPFVSQSRRPIGPIRNGSADKILVFRDISAADVFLWPTPGQPERLS